MERRARKAVELMAHAVVTTTPHTAEEVEACNARTARGRDFLLHAEARDIAGPGGLITAAEMETLRDPAVRAMRKFCQACGRCARFDLKPP